MDTTTIPAALPAWAARRAAGRARALAARAARRAARLAQLELWPGMPGGPCTLCGAARPAPATCGKCALRRERMTAPPLSWAEERALMRRELIRLGAERSAAERAHTVRLHRLAALGRPRPRRARRLRRGQAARPPSGAPALQWIAVSRRPGARRAHGR
jgi:hypothetical protein